MVEHRRRLMEIMLNAVSMTILGNGIMLTELDPILKTSNEIY